MAEFNMTDRANFLRSYYGNYYNIFEIIRFTKNREFAFLAPKFLAVEGKGLSSRTWRIHSIQHFYNVLYNGMRFDNITLGDEEIYHTQLQDLVFNCYISLATYRNGLPYQNIADAKRNNDEWKANNYKEIVSYDFLIDIDADYSHKTLGWSHESMKMVMDLLDKFSISYYVFPSGAGFQCLIPLDMCSIDREKYSYDPNSERNVYKFFTHILRLLKDNVSEMIDTKVCTDPQRVFKLPYTISNYEHCVYVCVPFSNRNEFNLFQKTYMLPSFWKGKFGKRGIPFFNGVPVNNEEKFINFAVYLEALQPKSKRKDYLNGN